MMRPGRRIYPSVVIGWILVIAFWALCLYGVLSLVERLMQP